MSVNEKMTAIADAIRSKTGGTDALTLDQMAVEIAGIEVGSGEEYTKEQVIGLLERTTAEFVVPEGCTKIAPYMFHNASALTSITLPDGITTIGDYAFYGLKAPVTKLPESLVTIGTAAFNLARSCTFTHIPASVTEIGSSAFNKCTTLTSLTFRGTPTTIYANSFNQCTNITTINVPWAEGAVPNAPWGATNATINYSYTGG